MALSLFRFFKCLVYSYYRVNFYNYYCWRTNPYTFDENNILRVDLHHGNELVALITFECNGGKLLMDGEFSHLWRLTSDCQ